MAIEFNRVCLPPIDQFTASAPDAAVIGLLGRNGSGVGEVLRAAGRLAVPVSGQVTGNSVARYTGPADTLDLSAVDVLVLDHALALLDAGERARAAIEIERLRRAGTTILISSHEDGILRRLCDEIWWLDGGRLAGKGDPGEMIARYRCDTARKLRAWGGTVHSPIAPSLRRGDGRAKLVSIDTLGEDGRPTMVWQSGDEVAVRVAVRFEQPVDDPVVGIMIRTRIGFEVYGTNTGLEGIKLGPCAAGDLRTVTFRFRCNLCPQEYTLTAASHDPDGVWHDWLEDALAFTVAGTRYTAGVANLRATVTVD